MADIIKDANYYYNRAAQARANGNERLAQMMENYAIQMDRDYGSGANGRDGYIRPTGRYEDMSIKGWNIGDSNQRYADAEKQAEQARLQAMYNNGVFGGAIGGSGNSYIDKGYSGVGDPEAKMQADYIAKIGNGANYGRYEYDDYGTNQDGSLLNTKIVDVFNSAPTIQEQKQAEDARRAGYAQKRGIDIGKYFYTDGQGLAGGKGDKPDWRNPFDFSLTNDSYGRSLINKFNEKEYDNP